MKIIDIETDENISDLKLLFEILNGYIHEANTEFIKDSEAYTKSLDKKKKHSGEDKTKKSDKDKYRSKNTDDTDDTDDNNNGDNDNYDDTHDGTTKNKSKASKQKIAKINKSKKQSLDDENDDLDGDGENSENDDVDGTETKKSSKTKKKSKNSKSQDLDELDNDDQPAKNKGKIIKKKESKQPKKRKSKDDDEGATNGDEDEEENPGLIKILTADPNQVMITFISLKASAFKKFIVHPDKYNVGLNLDELYKYMKNVDKEGTMTIHIDDEDTQNIVFKVTGENTGSYVSTCELRVLNLSTKKERKIETDVTMAVRLNCHRFHKACKDLMQFSQFIEITCDPSQLAITCKGELSNHKREFKADGTEKGAMIRTVKKDEGDIPPIIRLVFDLRYINYMYKCSSLCDDMEIYLNPDSVMFLKYGIKMMGEMFVGISPSKKKDQNKDYNEENEEFYNDDGEIALVGE